MTMSVQKCSNNRDVGGQDVPCANFNPRLPVWLYFHT